MTDASTPIVPSLVGDETTVAESPVRGFSAWWVLLACVAVALLVVEPALHGSAFLWTDRALVRNNDFLNRSAGLAMLWTGITNPATYPLPQYSPLTQTLFFIERSIWGDAAWCYRLTTALLHALAGAVLFQLLRGLRVRGAAIIAVLFVAHPLTVESVAWLTERRNVVAALFGLSSAFLALRAAGIIAPPPDEAKFKPLPPEPGRLFALAAVVQVLGLFASPSIAFLPGVVLLLAWWRRRTSDARLTGLCAGLMVVGLIFVFANAAVERSFVDGNRAQWDRDATPVGDLVTRVQLAGRATGTYVGKFVAPYGLSIDYPRPLTPNDAVELASRGGASVVSQLPRVGPNVLLAWLPPVILAGLLVAAWQFRDRIGRAPFVVGVSVLLLLLPSLGFVSLGWMHYSFVADRAAYLAAAAMMTGLVAGVAGLLRTQALLNAGMALAVLGLLALTILSRVAADRYETESGFWRATLNANPRSLLALEQAIAIDLNTDQPNFLAINHEIGEALKQHPREPSLMLLNARTFDRAGQSDTALGILQSVIRDVDIAYAPAYSVTGEIYRRIANANPNDPAPRFTSRDAFGSVCVLDPKAAFERLRLAEANMEIMRRAGQDDPKTQAIFDEVLRQIDDATQLQPFRVNTLLEAARLLLQLGKVADATTHLNVALTVDQDNPTLFAFLGEAYAKSNLPEQAEAAFEEALKLDPQSYHALVKLGALRQQQERWDAAREVLVKALEVNPPSIEARTRLGDVQAKRQTAWPPAPASTQPTTQAARATTTPAIGPTR